LVMGPPAHSRLAASKKSAEKYKRFTTRNRSKIQYNPLIPRAKLEKLENKGKQGKEQAKIQRREQWTRPKRTLWLNRTLGSGPEKARRQGGAGDARTSPRLEFQPSPILRAKASERKKPSSYPRGGTARGARWRSGDAIIPRARACSVPFKIGT